MQLRVCHRDNLCDHRSDRFLLAKDQRITRLNIIWTVRLDNAQDRAAKKHAALCRDRIPAFRVQVIDAVGKHEAEAAWPVALTMPLADIPNRRGEPPQRVPNLRLIRHRRTSGFKGLLRIPDSQSPLRLMSQDVQSKKHACLTADGNRSYLWPLPSNTISKAMAVVSGPLAGTLMRTALCSGAGSVSLASPSAEAAGPKLITTG